jgi:hypothetical protein
MTTANLSYKRVSSKPIQRPLRAIIEIVDGKLRIYPDVDNDTDERRVLDALRFVREDWHQ